MPKDTSCGDGQHLASFFVSGTYVIGHLGDLPVVPTAPEAPRNQTWDGVGVGFVSFSDIALSFAVSDHFSTEPTTPQLPGPSRDLTVDP